MDATATPQPSRQRPCPLCGEMIGQQDKQCSYCGEDVKRPPKAGSPSAGDSTGGLIPYKNPPALIAYYCGIFSLIACIPFLFPLPIAAFVLGLKGLKNAKAEPAVKGQVHAWIGIVCGIVFGLIGIATTVIAIIGIVASMSQPGMH